MWIFKKKKKSTIMIAKLQEMLVLHGRENELQRGLVNGIVENKIDRGV